MSDICCVMGGMGQVGSALASALSKKHSVIITDVREPVKPNVKNVKFLHVCIPWQEGFVEKVKAEADHFGAKIIVIHSTVPVGTTTSLGENAVSSPIRGQHDSLASGVLKFVKYVAGKKSPAVKKHLELVGIKCKRLSKPEDAELLKLLCLDRYLADLAWYQHAQNICKQFGTDTQAISDWTRSYNFGYWGTKWQRSELDFPNGKIGGHCVYQNSKILYDITKDEFTKKNLDMFNQ